MKRVLKLEARSGWGEVETIEVGRLERRVTGLTAEELGLTVNGGAKVGQRGGEISGHARREGWSGRERSAPPWGVSRVWRKVKGDWDAWSKRSLAEELIVRLILDGTAVRVRLDRQATSVACLWAPRKVIVGAFPRLSWRRRPTPW